MQLGAFHPPNEFVARVHLMLKSHFHPVFDDDSDACSEVGSNLKLSWHDFRYSLPLHGPSYPLPPDVLVVVFASVEPRRHLFVPVSVWRALPSATHLGEVFVPISYLVVGV